jgi:dihydrodipicolinate synthase/N-acetylneuraminate lyase
LRQQIDALAAQINTATSAISNVATTPQAELMQQMRDHWYQMAAQIEATRSGLAQVIEQQTGRMEMRLAALSWAASAPAAADTPAMRDAQRHIEQQTVILGELVNTLGVLDAHMQDIRSQMQMMKRAG